MNGNLMKHFSCETHWVPGKWEQCSATCGKQGVKYRYVELNE